MNPPLARFSNVTLLQRSRNNFTKPPPPTFSSLSESPSTNTLVIGRAGGAGSDAGAAAWVTAVIEAAKIAGGAAETAPGATSAALVATARAAGGALSCLQLGSHEIQAKASSERRVG